MVKFPLFAVGYFFRRFQTSGTPIPPAPNFLMDFLKHIEPLKNQKSALLPISRRSKLIPDVRVDIVPVGEWLVKPQAVAGHDIWAQQDRDVLVKGDVLDLSANDLTSLLMKKTKSTGLYLW